MQFNSTAAVNYLLSQNRVDAPRPTLDTVSWDLKAHFCCVPQWMGKTWAPTGCRDGT